MDNFKNFQEYFKNWTDPKLIKDLDNFMLDFATDTGLELRVRVVESTPVDTGALREAWQISKGKRDGDDYYIEIENGMNYASYVESGTATREWKWKNGAWMLKKSINSIQNEMPQTFSKKFRNFLNKRGIGG